MKNREKKQIKKLNLKWWISLGALPIIAGIILLIEINMMPGGLTGGLVLLRSQADLLELNIFPVFATICFLYLIIGSPFYAGAAANLIWGLLAYANLLKIDGRDDPLTPTDIALFREAMDAVGEYNLEMHWNKLIPVILFFALLIALGIKTRSGKRSRKVRLPLALTVAAIFAFQIHHTYTDKTRYYSYKVEERYNVALEYNTLGFNYCFLYNYNLYPVDVPDNFDKSKFVSLENSAAPVSPEFTPNIIFIMCEAFSDLADEDMFAYAEENNPLKDWHTLCESPNALNGYIAVSNYAAGTANTEFNVMTGMQTHSIGEGLTSSFRVLHDDTVSIASVLKDQGYDTFFMHPGKDWFYNRQNVYRYFGIDDQVFDEAFDESDYKGQMISDEAFYDELTSDLKTRMEENENPLFTYAVTIENHQAYRYYKFDFEPENAELSMEVSDDANENLAVYMEGVRDSSKLALELSEYVDAIDEPTVLVFFGDHRPNLGGTYAELGLDYSEGGDIATYEVPYVIYANRSYADKLKGTEKNLEERFASLDIADGDTISDNYLGAMVLELIGCGENDSFFSYLNELRRTVPFYRLPSSLGADDRLGKEASDLIHQWTYYRVKY